MTVGISRRKESFRLDRPHGRASCGRLQSQYIDMPGRKRLRCQASPQGNPSTSLPRVKTAPANLPSQQGTPNAISKTVAQPLTDDSELRAQISTLSLIKAHGYGPNPGTPLRGGGRTVALGAKRALRACATAEGTGGRRGGRKRGIPRPQASTRKAIRKPWMGPMDSVVSLPRKQGREVDKEVSEIWVCL